LGLLATLRAGGGEHWSVGSHSAAAAAAAAAAATAAALGPSGCSTRRATLGVGVATL